MPRLREDRYEKIISDYLSGMTQKQVGIENGVGRDAVGNILRKFCVPTREYTGSRSVARREWEWNTYFFDEFTHVTAYWAGFLIADGNITDKGNVMALVIQEKDLNHLEKFCYHIGLSTDAIYKDKKWRAYGIHLNYENLGHQLLKWGIGPRKSKKFFVPNFPVDLLPHFLRGWIDGDGSVYRYGRSSRIVVSSGNKESLEWFSDALRFLGYDGNIGVKRTSSKIYPNNYYLYIGGANQVSNVCDLLLVDEYFCMKRKWNSRRD